jgi:hypothetical protein
MLLSTLQWFSSLSTLEQVFWTCALVASVIFLVQIVLTLLGLDGHDAGLDFDASAMDAADGDTLDLGGGLALFSVRSLINFLLGFGWAGGSFRQSIDSDFLLVLVSALCGLAFVWLFFFIRKQMRRLETDGNFDIQRCVGTVCSVYLRIPAERTGVGKVQVSVGGAVHELDACTDGHDIKTGVRVRILSLVDQSTVLVEPVVG